MSQEVNSAETGCPACSMSVLFALWNPTRAREKIIINQLTMK